MDRFGSDISRRDDCPVLIVEVPVSVRLIEVLSDPAKCQPGDRDRPVEFRAIISALVRTGSEGRSDSVKFARSWPANSFPRTANDRRRTPAAPEDAFRVLRRDARRPNATGALPSRIVALQFRHAGAAPAAGSTPATTRHLPSHQRAVPFTSESISIQLSRNDTDGSLPLDPAETSRPPAAAVARRPCWKMSRVSWPPRQN